MSKTRRIALFQSPARDKIEKYLNDAYDNISKDGHEYISTKVWSEIVGKHPVWFASVEFSVDFDVISDEDRKNDDEEHINGLKRFYINNELSLSEIGYLGVKAFIVQNGLNINLDKSYHEMLNELDEKYNIDRVTKIDSIDIDLEVIDLEINLNGDYGKNNKQED